MSPVLRPRIVLGTLLTGLPVATSADSPADPWANPSGDPPTGPRADYLLHCGGCHLPDATGVPPLVPSLAGTLGRIASSPEGRDYIVRVPGASQTPLSDKALAAVMNWVLLTYNAETLPDDFEPLTGREVGRSRKNVLADPTKLRESLWPDYP